MLRIQILRIDNHDVRLTRPLVDEIRACAGAFKNEQVKLVENRH
jgi:hypothetical protein